jgi:hypothetical protein
MNNKIKAKNKILLVDGMFPNKFTIWRNNLIESLANEFDVDIAVYKTNEFAGIRYDFDYDFINEQIPISHYNILIGDPLYKDIQKFNKNYDGTKGFGKYAFSYVFIKDIDFNVDRYDVIYYLFLTSYLRFKLDFDISKKKNLIHLFAGGGFDYNSVTNLDKDCFYISSHKNTTAVLENNKLQYIECLGVPQFRAIDKRTPSKRTSPIFGINFSSMGFGFEKGDQTFVKIAVMYKFIFPFDKVRFTSIGNCKKSIFVKNYPPFDYVSLITHYENEVDVQLNLATKKAPNGWPLGTEAIKGSCVLITTDVDNASQYYKGSEAIIKVRTAYGAIKEIRRLYKSSAYYNSKLTSQFQFLLFHFGFDNQQKRIFAFLKSIISQKS